MNIVTAFRLLAALLVIIAVALQVQIIKINKRLCSLGDGADKK